MEDTERGNWLISPVEDFGYRAHDPMEDTES